MTKTVSSAEATGQLQELIKTVNENTKNVESLQSKVLKEQLESLQQREESISLREARLAQVSKSWFRWLNDRCKIKYYPSRAILKRKSLRYFKLLTPKLNERTQELADKTEELRRERECYESLRLEAQFQQEHSVVCLR